MEAETGAIKVYPMPVEDYANISFKLNAASDVEMSIYNIVGAKVATVEYGRYAAGDSGKMLETGLYILRMKAGNDVSSLKIMKR
jgi:hypothetical protein